MSKPFVHAKNNRQTQPPVNRAPFLASYSHATATDQELTQPAKPSCDHRMPFKKRRFGLVAADEDQIVVLITRLQRQVASHWRKDKYKQSGIRAIELQPSSGEYIYDLRYASDDICNSESIQDKPLSLVDDENVCDINSASLTDKKIPASKDHKGERQSCDVLLVGDGEELEQELVTLNLRCYKSSQNERGPAKLRESHTITPSPIPNSIPVWQDGMPIHDNPPMKTAASQEDLKEFPSSISTLNHPWQKKRLSPARFMGKQQGIPRVPVAKHAEQGCHHPTPRKSKLLKHPGHPFGDEAGRSYEDLGGRTRLPDIDGTDNSYLFVDAVKAAINYSKPSYTSPPQADHVFAAKPSKRARRFYFNEPAHASQSNVDDHPLFSPLPSVRGASAFSAGRNGGGREDRRSLP